MPITYTDITYISNGQAINADNLNAPSVDLATRTDEVKRHSDQVLFKQEHTTDSQVVLVSSSTENSNIVVRSQLKYDGSPGATLVKYYLPEFNNIKFSLYSKAVHGGRYIIDGADISSLFSDSIDASNPVLSTALSVPGDGIYAKVPLRHTGATESAANYPDTVYPKSKVQSLGEGYLSSGPNTELVKLPELVLMDLLSTRADEGVASFTARLQSLFADIDLVTVGQDGALQILDVNEEPLTLRVYGTQEGATCHVTHLLERSDGEPGLIVKFSRASSPIFIEHSTRVPTTSIGVSLWRGASQLGSSLTPIAGGDYTGYFILPQLLDPNYAYVPLVRLTENSLLVGDRNIPLGRQTLTSGEVINKHGDPVYGVPPEFSEEETAEYALNILSDRRISADYKKSYVMHVAEQVVDPLASYISASALVPVDLQYLKSALVVGDRVHLSSVTIDITQTLVTSLQDPDWRINASLYLDGEIRGALANVSSAPEQGDTVELLFGGPITITEDVTDIYFSLSAKAGDDGGLLSGGLSARFNVTII